MGTIVGESILINGNLQGDEDLTVQGRVEGTVNLTKTLNIEESGIVKANITVRNAIISGVVVGNISASDSVEITQVGRMVGDIKAPRVIIVEGARYRGSVDMGDLEAPRASAPLPARTIRPTTTTFSKPTAKPVTALAKKPMAAPTPAVAPAPAPAVAPVKKLESVTKPALVPVLAASKKIKKKVVVKKKS